jgi:hypothetical protein
MLLYAFVTRVAPSSWPGRLYPILVRVDQIIIPGYTYLVGAWIKIYSQYNENKVDLLYFKDSTTAVVPSTFMIP